MTMAKADTRNSRIVRGVADESGWKNLTRSSGEPLAGPAPSPTARSILSLVHLSDLHICDAQSPARVELMDRFADPHHPMSEVVKYVGVYRSQEILTVQTLEAMVQTVNAIEHGPVSNRPIDGVVITGDVTDNAQQNELHWYFTLLDGGEVHPDSGDSTVWEGVASTNPERYDRSYWNPEGTPDGMEPDFPRSIYGFPTIKGLTDAVRKPFTAKGLTHRWFATHGNHDALLQGTVAPTEILQAFASGDKRLTALAPNVDFAALFGSFTEVGPTTYPSPDGGEFAPLTPDSRRTFNKAEDWAKLHTSCGSGHDGHGLTKENVIAGTKYWFRDLGEIRLVSLDTVNAHGGWQGSLDETQFTWLKSVLADPTPRYFIMLSHHPIFTLFNLYHPQGGDRRVGEDELREELLKHDRIVLWLAGHNHEHHIDYVGDEGSGNGFYHIQTASNIDWPQQGRLVELLVDGEKLVIATSVFDHQSPITLEEAESDLENPVNMAGISRILSANHWQRRSGEHDLELGAGDLADRNRYLWVR